MIVVVWAIIILPANSRAQTLVFSEDFETDHNFDNTYVTNTCIGNGTSPSSDNTPASAAANQANLYFDYSTVGVPLSPHSTNSSTHALKLSCNIVAGNSFPIGISVSPVNFGITLNFDMHFDGWWNFDGPMPLGGPGSTEIGGAGYGTFGTNAQVAGRCDSIIIGAATDANTASSVRVYSPTHAASYQAGDYQIGSDGQAQTTHGDPTSGYVYAGTNGGRDLRQPPFNTEFPAPQCPNAQQALFPQQTNSDGTFPGQGGFANAGAICFKWHDVSLSKIGNVITYKIDGFLIATVNVADAGNSGGSNILFNMYDINSGGDTQATATNLLFFLVDNVRITNFPNVVTVNTASNNATVTEGTGVPGVFTITRTSAGTPLTVNYTMTGDASNGVDYVDGSSNALSGSVTFSANATSTNISVYAIHDGISEPTESIILNISPSTNYTGAGNATIRIVDVDPPVLTITNLHTQMFERTNDFATFTITRLGATNVASFPINVAFSGTATNGVNFYTNVAVTFEPGVASTNLNVYPIEDGVYTGNKTITCTISASGSYTVGSPSSATITLVDEDVAPEVVLFSDNLRTDTSANWTVLHVANDGVQDDSVIWAFDYSSQSIPPAPHSGGNTIGLFVTVNKNDANAVAAAVNLYPNGQTFSGDYALRFDMFQNITFGASSTEYVLAGLDHSGTRTNWWRSGGVPTNWVFDGDWWALETDAQSTPNFVNYSSPAVATGTNVNPTALSPGTNSAGFTSVFKSPPYTVAGSPANTAVSNVPIWTSVEVVQMGNKQILRMNNTTIYSYSNATPYTSGNIMLGYLDAFDSIGPIGDFAVFSNVRVVRINGLNITSVQSMGPNITVSFTFGLTDGPAGFSLQSSPNAAGPYTDTGATIVQTSAGSYQATVPQNGNAQFYRIHHL